MHDMEPWQHAVGMGVHGEAVSYAHCMPFFSWLSGTTVKAEQSVKNQHLGPET